MTISYSSTAKERLAALLSCFTGVRRPTSADSAQLYSRLLEQKDGKTAREPDEDQVYSRALQSTAENVILALSIQGHPGRKLETKVRTIIEKGRENINVEYTWWAEKVATRIYEYIMDMVVKYEHSVESMPGAMGEAFESAKELAVQFAAAHPVATAVVAIIVIAMLVVLLAPSILEALGFVARGPLPRSFAARWQSTYPDVPYKSLFSHLQRLASRYGKTLI